MASGNLYNETLRSAMREEAPRESRAWAAWVLLGMIAGASLAGIAYEFKERYRGADVRMSPTHSANTTAVPR